MSFFDSLRQGMQKTRENLSTKFEQILRVFSPIDDELYDELEEILLLADVGGKCSAEIVEELRAAVKKGKINDANDVRQLLKNLLIERLDHEKIDFFKQTPTIILVVGVNGVGKTTTIGKLATMARKEGKSVLLAAADTFRAAAADQLQLWAERAGCDILRLNEGADPASVIFDACVMARKRGFDCLICDTAGRLHNKKNLMQELAKITKCIQRELGDATAHTVLVLDATTGQNAVVQAEAFCEVANVTDIVVTKLDGTAKGGVVVPIRDVTNLPIAMIGVGEGSDHIEYFDAHEFVEALFDEE